MGQVIGISAAFVKPGIVGGAEHMLMNLVRGLAEAADCDDHLLVLGNAGGQDVNGRASVQWVSDGRARNRFLEEWRYTRRYLPHLDAVLLPNYFTPPVRAREVRIITVIHDLQYRHFPENFSLQKRLWLRAAHELTLRLADAVVVISDFVKDDLLRAYGSRLQAKVHVIPNPVSWARFEEGEANADFSVPDGRYVLSVAAQYPHKNLETLVRAFALLAKRRAYDDVSLVLAGQFSHSLVGIARRTDVRGLIATLGLERQVRVTGYISDRALGVHYRHATAFVFPSLFEGFGMPPVEALGFGLPVITTRCAALPESTRGLAHYVDDPFDAQELAEALAVVLDDPRSQSPTPASVLSLRANYAPAVIGAQYYALLTGSR
jgi:glycosyltransferase involved in cell wall biosynthesis